MRAVPWLAWLALLAVAAPVAQKGVIEQECDAYGDCHRSEGTVVTYRLLGSNVREVDDLPDLPAGRDGTMVWHVQAMPHEDGKLPLLAWGGIATLVGAPATTFVLRRHMRMATRTSWRWAVATYTAWASAVAAFAFGLVYHSATWTGAEVTFLHPHIGVVALLGALGAGAALRPVQTETAMPALPGIAGQAEARPRESRAEEV